MAKTPDESAPARTAFESAIEAIAEEQGTAAPGRSPGTATDLTELLDQAPEREGMPRELVHSISGGIETVIQRRLDRGGEEDLGELVTQLWDWLCCYPVPAGPLKATRRNAVRALPFEERQAHSSPQERIMRALAAVVAEQGYPETTVAEVVNRASASQRTFYKHFKNKDDATLATLDSGSSRMLAAALPSFRRAPDWEHAVHDTIEAMLAFAAEEPEYARLGGLAMDTAGRAALDQREMVIEGMEGLLAPGYELEPDAPPIAAEAAGSALYARFYDHVNRDGPETLPDLVPSLVYVALAPFLGGEEAYAVSIG